MKRWKNEIVSAVVKAAESDRIVRLRDVARSCGYDHIQRQDAVDILHAVCRMLPGYRPMRIVSYQRGSLFQELAFVENCVEFTSEDQWFRELDS